MKAPVGREEAYHCEGDHKLSAPAGMRLQMHSLEVCLELICSSKICTLYDGNISAS